MKTLRLVAGIALPFLTSAGWVWLADLTFAAPGKPGNTSIELLSLIAAALVASFLCGYLLRSLWALVFLPIGFEVGALLAAILVPGVITASDQAYYVAAFILVSIATLVVSIPGILAGFAGIKVATRAMGAQGPSASPAARNWIPLIVVGVPLTLAVLGCAGILVLFAIADTGGPVAGDAVTVAQHYYTALQQGDDKTAYTYLAAGATLTINGQDTVVDTEQTLASLAQAADQREGTITTFTAASDENFEAGKPIVDMTMHVTRTGQSYDVHMQVDLSSSNGKILHADGI